MSNYHSDEGIINLRGDSHENEPEFRINHIDDDTERSHSAPKRVAQESVNSHESVSEQVMVTHEPTNQVKVKFDKFVSLIANHDCEEILDKYMEEDIIVSTDLLTDIANSHQEKQDDKKISLIFFVGALIGVVITWILLKT